MKDKGRAPASARKLIRLEKTVLEFSGEYTQFLNDMTSNKLDCPHNAFLDIKGRVIATFDQIHHPPEYCRAIIESRYLERVEKHLAKYLELSEAKMEVKPYHVYFDSDGKYTVTEKEIEASWDPTDFDLYRVQNRLPVQGVDYDEELLLNVNSEDYVNYEKGCYLGQEIIARVHFKSKPPRKLTVKFADECSPEEAGRLTSRVTDPETKRMMGFVFVANT